METEYAWAAGLFEGKGSISLSDGRPKLQLKLPHVESGRRFEDVVGGKLYGPYEDGDHPAFYLWVAERAAAQTAFDRMRPWLSQRRLDRFAEVFGE